jgi:mRNA-degrading endonuclease HigB of HigAB toxin-antitoxin module
LTRWGTLAAPGKADLIEPPVAFAAHFVFPSPLHSYPMAKTEISLDVNSGHVAVTFTAFECPESLKSLFPPSIKFTPNKSYLIELRSAPVIVVVLIVTLNGYPLTEPIATLPVVTENAAMTFPFFEREKHVKAFIPSLFRRQPFALSEHIGRDQWTSVNGR